MKILVIGDSCLDIYNYGICPRLCPDAPVPVFISEFVVSNGGMALNTCNNVKALGVDCHIVTNSKTITKTRYVEHRTNQMIVRIDSGDNEIDKINLNSLDLPLYDGVIISDYIKGFLLESDIEYICENHDNVLIDTKRLLGKYCSKAKFIKVNETEYQNSLHLLNDLNLEKSLIVTLGSNGCIYNGKKYPVKKIEIKDHTGAGDTFVSGFMVEYLRTRDMDKSLNFANKCASYVVQKKGVSVVDGNLC